MINPKKNNVAIIGSGNIGTDLLVKLSRSDILQCSLFTGRNLNSSGMNKALSLGVNISDKGIQAIIENPEICELVIDCTSAQAHAQHWPILDKLGKFVIDMTPAKIGELCIPAINASECISSGSKNINLITCGGQASIPIAYAISQVCSEIEYIEVASSIASRSAGPATRLNLDEYVETTEKALSHFTGVVKTKAILILNPAQPPIDMQTTIYVKAKNPDINAIKKSVDAMVDLIVKYVPEYKIIVAPVAEQDRVVTTVKVLGNGDYLPRYAGNLDIINCAAIAIAELYSKSIVKN
jgi:acetaldehyde dehydrogenase